VRSGDVGLCQRAGGRRTINVRIVRRKRAIMSKRKIVVGVDASPSSVHALRWACHHHRDGDEIVAVLAWDYPTLSLIRPPPGTASRPGGSVSDVANETLRRAVAAATTNYNVPITKVAIKGSAAHSVLETAEDADLIVLGTRGAGITKVLLGSVSRRVLHQAKIPVVIVPDGAPLDYRAKIAVAVDGSDHSMAALRWARALDVQRIEVIHTWHQMRSYSPYMAPVGDPELETTANETIDRIIADVLEGQTDERLEKSVIGGDARTVLTDADFTPGLLVMGSRGFTGIVGAFIGSVTDFVVAHSDVAVAVIPASET
jgi:nucleotide-binding universal stress UspA family protein